MGGGSRGANSIVDEEEDHQRNDSLGPLDLRNDYLLHSAKSRPVNQKITYLIQHGFTPAARDRVMLFFETDILVMPKHVVTPSSQHSNMQKEMLLSGGCCHPGGRLIQYITAETKRFLDNRRVPIDSILCQGSRSRFVFEDIRHLAEILKEVGLDDLRRPGLGRCR